MYSTTKLYSLLLRNKVLGRGLEPPRLAAPAPKAGVSTIPPPQHFVTELLNYYITTYYLVRPLGLEPRTNCLREKINTINFLLYYPKYFHVRLEGLEPPTN